MLDWLIVAQILRPRWPATGLGASYVAHTHIISSSWKLHGGASSKTNSRHNMGFNTDWQQSLTHESSSQGLQRYEKVKKEQVSTRCDPQPDVFDCIWVFGLFLGRQYLHLHVTWFGRLVGMRGFHFCHGWVHPHSVLVKHMLFCCASETVLFYIICKLNQSVYKLPPVVN